MIHYASEVTVDRPVEQVFRFVSNVDNFSRWTDMTDSSLEKGNQLGLGSKILTTIRKGPVKVKMVFEMAEFRPNQKMTFKSVSDGPMSWDATFDFRPIDGNSTVVSTAGDLGLRGVWRLVEPLMANEVRTGEAKELETLKLLLESSPEKDG